MLHGVLERNIDAGTARDFKQGLLAHLTRTGALLERACPFLAAAAGGPGGAVLPLRVHALAVGSPSWPTRHRWSRPCSPGRAWSKERTMTDTNGSTATLSGPTHWSPGPPAAAGPASGWGSST